MNFRTLSFLLCTVTSVVALAACGSASDVTLGGAADTGGDGGGTDAAPPPSTYPRLVVASRAYGISIWNNVDRVTTDRAADVRIAITRNGARQVALHGDRLFVSPRVDVGGTDDPVWIFDGASRLAVGATVTDTLPQSAFPGSSGSEAVQVDAVGGLWTNQLNGPWLVGDALSVNHSTIAKAHFTHPWGQIGGFVYDPVGDRLLGGQISGAGALAWNAPRTKSGDGIAFDWTISPSVVLWSQSIAKGRYWAADYGTHVYAWNDVATLSAPRAPDVTLDFPAGPPAPQTSSVRVTDGDVLLVTLEMPGEIDVWKNASTVTSGMPPSVKITDPAIASSLVRGAILGKTGRLYVRDDLGVAIFDDALGTPKFVTRISDTTVTGEIATDRSFLLLE
jgi:hypothetical protein